MEHSVNGVEIDSDIGYCRSVEEDKELLKAIKKCPYFISYDEKKRFVNCKRVYQVRLSSCRGCKHSSLFKKFKGANYE